MIHLAADHPVHGQIPLCGRADWSSLTRSPELNECWECRSIDDTAEQDRTSEEVQP